MSWLLFAPCSNRGVATVGSPVGVVAVVALEQSADKTQYIHKTVLTSFYVVVRRLSLVLESMNGVCLRTGNCKENLDLRKGEVTGDWRKFDSEELHNL
jgi:hypothetical protein